ncbi:hypothetical protein RMCBS344292_02995 [Rhizopus microsporus]|nr:hypothetical protein RMCBS344292_02995 [Rhizopus microsporus]
MSMCMKIVTEAGPTTEITEIIFCYLIVSICKYFHAEDNHVHTYLDPILGIFLCTERELVSSWANKQDASGLKPDVSLSCLPWNDSFIILSYELKPEHTSSVLKDGYLSDLVKLGKQMKQNLEQMVIAGVASPLSFETLGKGMKLSLMIMDIDNEAVYRLYEYASFDIVGALPGFARLPTIIETFSSYKKLIDDVANNVEKV